MSGRSFLLGILGLFICCSESLAAGNKSNSQKTAWISASSPWGVWAPTYKKAYPVKMIMRDLAESGFDSVMFLTQHPRGGPFSFRTETEYAVVEPKMGKDRDFLRETLAEADKYNMKVWVGFSTPRSPHGRERMENVSMPHHNKELKGFNDPEIEKLYANIVNEIGNLRLYYL